MTFSEADPKQALLTYVGNATNNMYFAPQCQGAFRFMFAHWMASHFNRLFPDILARREAFLLHSETQRDRDVLRKSGGALWASNPTSAVNQLQARLKSAYNLDLNRLYLEKIIFAYIRNIPFVLSDKELEHVKQGKNISWTDQHMLTRIRTANWEHLFDLTNLVNRLSDKEAMELLGLLPKNATAAISCQNLISGNWLAHVLPPTLGLPTMAVLPLQNVIVTPSAKKD